MYYLIKWVFSGSSYHYFINFSLRKDSFLFRVNLIVFVVVLGDYIILSKNFYENLLVDYQLVSYYFDIILMYYVICIEISI